MNCNVCNAMLVYMGGDCYCCPIHGWDYLKTPVEFLKDEFELDTDEAKSMFETQKEENFGFAVLTRGHI